MLLPMSATGVAATAIAVIVVMSIKIGCRDLMK